MKNRKVTRILAAVLTGAMLMATPSVAMADWAVQPGYTVDASVPAVAGLQVIYRSGIPYLTWANNLTGAQRMYIEVSTDAAFTGANTDCNDTVSNSWSLDYLTPGKTYYIRTIIRDGGSYYDDNADDYVDSGVIRYGAYSSVVTFTGQVPDVRILDQDVKKTSVNFRFRMSYEDDAEHVDETVYKYQYKWDYNNDGVVDAADVDDGWSIYNGNTRGDDSAVTGFEIYRANKTGKYKKIATVTDTQYKDTGLKSDTTYRYRIRAYVLDKATGQKIYGDWEYTKVTTWGKDLNLQATASNTKAVKLSWNKVSGADGYKIYRAEGASDSTKVKDGLTSGFTNYELIKTISKVKTVKYKDKDVKAGETYSYKVVAFKENNATKKTVLMGIEDRADITLGFEDNLIEQKRIRKADGSIELHWNRIIGAEGYVVEKYNETTDQYDRVTVLPANATTYTFSASATDKDPNYHIYAYAGNSYTDYIPVSPSYRAARTSGIVASPTVLADGTTGISVSWQPVAGAAYYKVYRSRQYTAMNADSGDFAIPSADAVVTLYKAGKLSDDGTYYVDFPEYTDKITSTSVVDSYQGYPYMSYENNQQIIKTQDVADSPQEGVRYYYYVQAFAADGEPVVNEYESYTSTRTIYEGGWVGAPASAMINNVTATKPVIKKVKAEGKGKVEVAWKKSAKADKYIVYYSTKKKSGYTYGGITSKNKITIKGLTPGKTYYFQVKGVKANAAGGDVYSSLSKAKSVKVR